MGVYLAHILLLAAVTAAPSRVSAMSPPVPPSSRCQVVGGERLPAAVAGDRICAEIARAMTERAPQLHYSVKVEVLSRSRLSAIVTVDGRTLPQQNIAVSDGELGPAQIHRFADSVAVAATRS